MHFFALALAGVGFLGAASNTPDLTTLALLTVLATALMLGVTSGMGAPRFVLFFLSAATLSWAVDLDAFAVAFLAAASGAAWGRTGRPSSSFLFALLFAGCTGAFMALGPNSLFDPWQAAGLTLFLPYLVVQYRLGRIWAIPAGATAGMAVGLAGGGVLMLVLGGVFYLLSRSGNIYLRYVAVGLAIGALFGGLLSLIGVSGSSAPLTQPAFLQAVMAVGVLGALHLFLSGKWPNIVQSHLYWTLLLALFLPTSAGLCALIFVVAAANTPQRTSTFAALLQDRLARAAS